MQPAKICVVPTICILLPLFSLFPGPTLRLSVPLLLETLIPNIRKTIRSRWLVAVNGKDVNGLQDALGAVHPGQGSQAGTPHRIGTQGENRLDGLRPTLRAQQEAAQVCVLTDFGGSARPMLPKGSNGNSRLRAAAWP